MPRLPRPASRPRRPRPDRAIAKRREPGSDPPTFFSHELRETPAADKIERLLSRFTVRALLSVLILISLVPHEHESTSDLVFFAVFGFELALRGYVFAVRLREVRPDESRARTTRKNTITALLLLFDLLALLSFLPWHTLLGGAFAESRLLRVFRLFRMLLFVGYWSPVLKDGLSVLTRHDRLRQVGLLGLVVGLMAFAGATLISHLPVSGVDFNEDGQLTAADQSFWPRLWWAFRQIQDAGNLVSDPAELAVVIVSLLLTLAGLFVVSFLIGLASDVVRELVEVSKNRPVGWKRHTVIVNATPGLPTLLTELTRYYEKLFRRPRLVVTDLAPEPPPRLRQGELARVRWRQVDERQTGLTALADVATARRVIVQASLAAPFPDAQTAATILDVREASQSAWIVAEVLDPNNVPAARVAGGPRTIVVPTEKLLGIWALAAIRRPEQLPLATELLVTRGGYEIYTFFFDADGLDGAGRAWDPGMTDLAGLMDLAAGLVESRRLQGTPRALQPTLAGVLPIGIMRARGEAADPSLPLMTDAVELELNPRGPLAGRPRRPVRALVAVAHHFEGIRALGHYVLAARDGGHGEAQNERVAPPSTSRRSAPPPLHPPPRPRRATRVLMCGFRAASPVVAAGLCAEGEDVEVTLVMRHGDSVRSATQALREHGLGSPGASAQNASGPAMRCFAGAFEPEGPAAFRWVPLDGKRGGLVTLVQADWTSERTLLGKEDGIVHVSRYELVLLLGSPLPEYDGRTSMAVLKIADIARQHAARFPTGPQAFRVVAGISDIELGRRLAESYKKRSGRALELLDTESLRALFMCQAVAVPGWETIFLALLGPGGDGLVRLEVGGAGEVAEAAAPAWTVGELARAYYERGLLVLGVELVREGQVVRRLAAQGTESFTSAELRAVWVIGPEP